MVAFFKEYAAKEKTDQEKLELILKYTELVCTRVIKEYTTKEKTEHEKLELILRYANLLSFNSGPWVFSTFALSIFTSAITLSLPVQYVEVWIRPGCYHPV